MNSRYSLWFGLSLCWLLFGCNQSVPPSAALPQPTKTATAPQQSTVQVTATLPNNTLADSLRQTLAQQLHLSISQITIVSVQTVTWPDACLGVAHPNLACAQILTPGYRIILHAPTGQYEYHTDLNGENIVTASAPTSDSSKPSLVYQQKSVSICNQTSIDFGSVEIGFCGGPLTDFPFANFDRQAELEELTNTYISFKIENPAETIQFTGAGTAQPSLAEQRSILEWARLVSYEAYGGRNGAAYGLTIVWHRAGGLAGFCDDVSIFSDGFVTTNSCKGGQARNLGKYRLTSDQLEQMYHWLDSFKNAEINPNSTNPDALTIHLIFSGQGSRAPTSADLQAMQDFAADVFSTSQKPKKP